jgi:hypothetical protein
MAASIPPELSNFQPAMRGACATNHGIANHDRSDHAAAKNLHGLGFLGNVGSDLLGNDRGDAGHARQKLRESHGCAKEKYDMLVRPAEPGRHLIWPAA